MRGFALDPPAIRRLTAVALALLLAGCQPASEPDTSPPVIELLGDNPLYVLQGTAFADPGARAEDDVDGRVEVRVSGGVDTAVLGNYQLVYTARDRAGNEASVRRSVNVVLPASAYPPETEFVEVDPQPMERPGYLQSGPGPAFGYRITRVTDPAEFPDGEYDVQPYPKHPAWSSDEAYIAIHSYKLIKGAADYSRVRETLYLDEARWAYTEPGVMYGFRNVYDGGERVAVEFVRLNVNDDAVTPLQRFYLTGHGGGAPEYDGVYLGPWEGNLSRDDRYVVFSARQGDDLVAMVFDIPGRRVVTSRRFAGIWDRLDWISISPRGDYVLMNWSPPEKDDADPDFTGAIDEYDASLNFVRRLAEQGQHGDMGLDAYGDEVYVQLEFGDRVGVWSYRLRDGAELRLLPDKYNGGHVSCQNYRRPGWCYLSLRKTGFAEVVAVKLDGSGLVNRFVQHRNSAGGSAYGSPNPSGTRVIFKSDWQGEYPVAVFVAEPER